MVNKRAFSLYDIEQFLKEAGAEKINEKAVLSLEMELQDTVRELVSEASLYANYAGRKRMIKLSDIDLVKRSRMHVRYVRKRPIKSRINRARKTDHSIQMGSPKLMLINNVPVVRDAQSI